jgi:tetratricopeptide (TPR) repeat protein
MIETELGNYEQALDSMEQARRISPDDLGLRAQEAKIHRRSGNTTRALELLVGLVPREKAFEAVATELAASYSQIGEHRKAAEAWTTCYRANSANPLAWRYALRAAEEFAKAGAMSDAAFWLQYAEIAAPNSPQVQALRQALTHPGQGSSGSLTPGTRTR